MDRQAFQPLFSEPARGRGIDDSPLARGWTTSEAAGLLLDLDRLARLDGDRFSVGAGDRDGMIAGVGGGRPVGTLADDQGSYGRWPGTTAPFTLALDPVTFEFELTRGLTTRENRGGGEGERGCDRRIGAPFQEDPPGWSGELV